MSDSYLRRVDDPSVYQEIRQVLDRQDLILFAGAGFSAQAKTPSGLHPPLWTRCLDEMLSWFQREGFVGDELAADIRELIDAGFLIDAAQEIEEAVHPASSPAMQRCLREVLFIDTARVSRAHLTATKLGFRAYLTTNYDDLIENAYARVRHRSLLPFYEETCDGVLDAWRRREPFILKMHGDTRNHRGIVLGARSYRTGPLSECGISTGLADTDRWLVATLCGIWRKRPEPGGAA